MEKLVYTIIILSSLSNLVADLFLFSGKDYSIPDQTDLEQIRNTPEKNLLISGLLGVFSIAFWLVPLLYLQNLTGVLGKIAGISFAMYIGSIMVFHAVCGMAMHLCKANEEKQTFATNYIRYFGAICLVFSLIYSVTIILISVEGHLTLQWFHYLGLPIVSVVTFQFIIGGLLKNIPYVSAVSGTLSMMISLLLTVHLMLSNLV